MKFRIPSKPRTRLALKSKLIIILFIIYYNLKSYFLRMIYGDIFNLRDAWSRGLYRGLNVCGECERKQ